MSDTSKTRPETGQGGAPRPAESSPLPGFVRWFVSSTYRHARSMRKHVHRLLCAQRDILPSQNISALQAAIAEMDQAVQSGADTDALVKQMESLEKSANKWIKPYPNAAWREN